VAVCEPEIIRCFLPVQEELVLDGDNILGGKDAIVTQSSTGWGGAPERAVDGNTSGNYKDKSCTHT